MQLGTIGIEFNSECEIECQSITQEHKGAMYNIIEYQYGDRDYNEHIGIGNYQTSQMTEADAKITVANMMLHDRLEKIRKLQEEATKLSIFIRDCI
jgi:hypothetical protein